jgi:hypothetical protein
MAIRLIRVGWIIFWIVLVVVPVSCSSGTTSESDLSSGESTQGLVWFEDVTDAVGLDFVQDPGPTGDYFMPQANGSGCAFIHEKDNLYIYLLNNAGPNSKSVNRLYQRTPDGKFKDVTEGSGLDVAGYSQGVAVGDVKNDGLPDVLLTQYGGIKLFLNQGNGKFKEVTVAAGLSNPLWGTSAAFFDYDRDGWLDLVITNYVDYDPQTKCTGTRGMDDFCGPAHFPAPWMRWTRSSKAEVLTATSC